MVYSSIVVRHSCSFNISSRFVDVAALLSADGTLAMQPVDRQVAPVRPCTVQGCTVYRYQKNTAVLKVTVLYTVGLLNTVRSILR